MTSGKWQKKKTQATEMRALRCIADKRRVDTVRSEKIREELEQGGVLGKVQVSQSDGGRQWL